MTEQRVRKSQAGPPPRNVAEAKRAEASLRFEVTVLGQVAEAVVAIDNDQRIIYMNPAAERRYGVAAEEARGRRLDEVYEYHWLNPGDEASAQQALAVAGFWQGENLHIRRDGTRIHVESSVSLLKDESGRPTGMLAVIRDVTERKQAEEQLRLTEQRFARFMQHLPGLAWIKDLSGRYVFANDATARAFGMSPAQLFGKTDTDLFPPEVAQQFQENDRRALQSEAGIHAVETLKHADGTPHYSIVSKFPIPGADGKPALIGGMAIDITERRHAEQRLRESEERFAKAFNASPLILTLSSLRDGRLLEVNETFVNVSGYRREEAVGRTTVELGLWLSAADREEEMNTVRQAGKVRNAEYRFRTRSGEDLIGLVSAERIDIGGEPCALTVIQDITERTRAEIARRESEERFRHMADHAPVMIWVTEPDGITTFLSKSWYDFTGQTLETGLGFGWLDAVHPEDSAHARDTFLTASQKQEAFRAEYRVRNRQGEYRWVIDAAVPRIAADGRFLGYIGSVIDITEEKRKEEALRNSERLYRAIGESINYGVWVCDPEGRNIYASESFLRLVGVTQEQCSEFGWSSLMHPDEVERTMKAWKECVRTGGQWDFEHRFRGADGNWHPILSRGVPVRNEREEIVAWAGINLDIGRQKQVENELREADQRKNEFLATLAHELRNPLAPIRNGLEIMRLARDNRDASERARSMMERQLQQMVRLIDDLLDLSRISRGKVELRKERVDLTAVVQSAVETSAPVIEQSGHELSIVVPSEPVWVDGDVTRLAQVFANLLNNAAKYTEQHGHIRLTLTRSGSRATVSVKDNGVGIPAHLLPYVFEMFTRINRPLERTQGGLGIGLSIVKRLVEMHGGTVEAHSDGPGAGSEFIVHLPALASSLAAAQPPVDEAIGTDASDRRRILIADDNSDSAASLAIMLKMMGNEVRTARDGVEAFEVAQAFRPELILLDIGMPRLNGYDTCRLIREQPWGADIKIAAMTGWGQDEDKRRSQEAGFTYHLVKPVEPNALARLLAGLSRTSA